MRVGAYISGAAHAGLVGWLVLGWGLRPASLEMNVMDVSVVSGAAFDQALRAGEPEAEVEAPSLPVPASDAPAAPAPIVTPEPVAPPAPRPRPEAAPPPAPDAPAREAAPPAAPAQVSDAPPETPEAPVAAPAPNLEIGTSLRPKARPVTRLAPVAAPEPERPAQVSDAPRPDARPEPEAPPPEPSTENAPEAAATEVITEADKPSFAPEISRRPRARPANLAAPREDAPASPAEAESPAPAEDALAAALAQALANAPASSGSPLGQSLTQGEVGSFLGQIGECWYIEAASTDAQKTTVALLFRLSEAGMVVPGSITRAGFEGGDAAAAEIAYRVAEQAVLECQSKGRMGYDLPAEKFPLWQELKIKFNPETMRLR